jgi:protein-S-isoprenylcysteine O-methyltransferase Ste14
MTAFQLSWAVLALFLASWVGSALWAGRATGSAGVSELASLYGGGALFLVLLGAAAWFLPAFTDRLWPAQPLFDFAMVAACIAACAWCWWARVHIGRLWAGGVTVREGHHVVDTGPYAVVRHPIYTGAFVLVLAFGAIRARPLDVVFTLGFIAFFAIKAGVEERFLRQQLGPAYDDYRTRVPMLLPGGPRRALAAREESR